MELNEQFEIDAPVEKTWAVVGTGFGDIGQWATSVVASRLGGRLGVGAHRTCKVAAFGPIDGGEIVEELIAFEPSKRRLAYHATSGLPAMMLAAGTELTVEPIGGERSRVTARATIELAWWARAFSPLLKRRIHTDLQRFAEELRYRVERGCPHPRKAKAA